MAKNLLPMKPSRVSIKDPESPRMRALNGGSAASGTLYTYHDNFRAYKALVAAEFSGAKVRVVSDPPDFVLGETNKTVAYLAKFPMGKVPAFESADGKNLFESNAIAFYLANEQLRGVSVEDQAFVLQWIAFADHELLPPAGAWVFPFMGLMDLNRLAVSKAKSQVRRILGVMDDHLKTRTFLVCERITLGDICCMCNLLHPYKWVFDPKFRAPFTHLNRWFMTMINQPRVKKVIGEVTLCPVEAHFDAKKVAEFAVSLSPKKTLKQRRQCSADDPDSSRTRYSPKMRQRAYTLPEDCSDDDEDDYRCCENSRVGSLPNHSFVDPASSSPSKTASTSPHPHRPLHISPRHAYLSNATPTPPMSPRRRKHLQQHQSPQKSSRSTTPRRQRLAAAEPPVRPTFSLEILKSIYETEDLEASVLPYFYDNFDADGFSIWLAEYRYPKDLGVMFQSEALVHGMFQRLESMRSHAFGIVGLFGRSRGAQIQGLWIWKGKELLFETNPQWQADYGNYEWFPLSIAGHKTKEIVKDFFHHKEDNMRYRPFRAGTPMAAMTLYSANIFK